jgi:cell division inhibitor SepF
VSLISRLRAVVAGDDYLDGELDDFAYDDEQQDQDQRATQADGGVLATLGGGNPFDFGGDLPGSNVIGMPGISTAAAEVNVMEPRSFDETPRAIQALRERKTVILNLTMMEPDQAQRAVDFVAGGTFAIDGHQERVGESIFLFAPSCVTVTNASQDETSSPTVVSRENDVAAPPEAASAPSPAWGTAAL